MDLAKPRIDIGIATNLLQPQLDFWQHQVGLPFEEMLPTGGGRRQHRHNLNGSVFKLNHARDPLPEVAPAGYRRLTIAREGLAQERELVDPDGNPVLLTPAGKDGVVGLRIELAVRDPDAFHRFYGEAMELPPAGADCYQCGDSLISFSQADDAPADASMQGRGYRYITVQVFNVDQEHSRIIDRGGREGSAPRTLGDVARISFVRDPDGNWIEISQRKSLTGTLEK